MQRKYLKIIPLKSFVGLENLVKLSFYQQVFFYHFIQGFTHCSLTNTFFLIYRNPFEENLAEQKEGMVAWKGHCAVGWVDLKNDSEVQKYSAPGDLFILDKIFRFFFALQCFFKVYTICYIISYFLLTNKNMHIVPTRTVFLSRNMSLNVPKACTFVLITIPLNANM